MKAAAILAGAGVVYVMAAWSVAPGFYDGGIALPYNFVCPPPQAGQTSPPKSGHADIKVIDGVSDANSAYTSDGQAVMGFLPGAFNATAGSTILVDVTPVNPCPRPAGLHFATNVYLISSSALLVKSSGLVLRYSDVEPDPSFIYRADSPDGPWQNIGSGQQAEIWTINTTTRQLGYFAAGYPTSAISRGGSGSRLLPIVVAVLIVLVLIAGTPLAILRRRRANDPEDADLQ